MSGRILALDPATVAGFCVGAPGAAPEHHGSIRFAPAEASTARLFGEAAGWLAERLREWAPVLVVCEAPLPPFVMRGHTNTGTTRISFGLAAIFEAAAYAARIEAAEAAVGDVRGFFIGRRGLRSADAKRAVGDRCRLLGIEPTDHNAADAIALWFYACALRAPATAAQSTPLFGAAVPPGTETISARDLSPADRAALMRRKGR